MAGKILVVDDVATNRIILKAKLSLACYDVLQAADGPQALTVAAQARPDLILLDLAMPGMDGIAVLRALKADAATAHIPVIVVTGHADTRSRIAGLRAGAEDFLTKPVDEAVLAARVRSLLRDRIAPADLDLRHAAAGDRAVRAGPLAQLEDTSGAEPAQHADAPGHEAPSDLDPSFVRGTGAAGLIALVGPDAATIAQWQAALTTLVPHRVVAMTRAEALRLARVDARTRPDAGSGVQGPRPDTGLGRGTGGTRSSGLPDVFVLASDIEATGDGLMLLSELRAGAATRHAAILVALPRAQSDRGPMALDLGACDLLIAPLAPEEIALRVSAQLQRKRVGDAQRARLRDGLQLALTDPLTGLGNRRYAMSHLARLEAEARAGGQPYSVLLLDLDRFKQVNDRFGHAAGDAVLRCVAERLARTLRGGDLIARFGGEEFLVALAETDAAGVDIAAERLRRAIETPTIPLPCPTSSGRAGARADVGALTVAQTVSIGIATADPSRRETGDADTATTCTDSQKAVAALLDRADRALYAAKAAGRNCVRRTLRATAGDAAA